MVTNCSPAPPRPALALDAITQGQATFINRDLAMFVHRHSDGKEQFDRVMAAVKAAPELVALGKDGRGEQRFTSRTMIETEQRLEQATIQLDARRHHGVGDRYREAALARAAERGMILSPEQRSAFDHVTSGKDLGVIVGYAGTGKSAMLGVAREAWEAEGYHVQGLALSGIAAENLESGSGISSRTIASIEHQWAQDRDRLTDRHVLVIDEAGMIGTRQMERVISEAQKSGAKVVLVGDPEQLQAIEAGAAFRSVTERHGSVEITAIRRQREDWQRDATRHLATGRTAEAVRAYEDAGHVHVAHSRAQASADLIDRWDRDRQAHPDASRFILTHTNDAVHDLNLAARARLRAAGGLGDDIMIAAERGRRDFAVGDRIMFLKNERSLGVKNGSLGLVQSATAARMAVMLDDGRSVAFDIKDYAYVDHGYAATIHKAQGVTVDRVHVLATPGLDRHAAYVALSRHRTSVDLHYGQDDFADRDRLVRTLSRECGKDMASDYARAFGDRREIRQEDAEQETAARNPFAGLRLRPVQRPEIPQSVEARKLSRDPVPLPNLEAAVERHGRIIHAMRFSHSLGDPYTPEQRAELTASRAALDGMRPQCCARSRKRVFERFQDDRRSCQGTHGECEPDHAA
jgi:Ti-type conjugative transfer relaxase TraA